MTKRKREQLPAPPLTTRMDPDYTNPVDVAAALRNIAATAIIFLPLVQILTAAADMIEDLSKRPKP